MRCLFTIMITFSLFLLSCDQNVEKGDVLIFSKTESFRHESIEAGIEAIKKLGLENDFTVSATEDARVFEQSQLKDFKVIVFLNTTGDILTDGQQVEFKRFIQAGGGFVGIHSAADTEYDWPWYGKLCGAYFKDHPNDPNVRDASIDVLDKTHISCTHLPDRWDRTDEWYNYKSISPDVTVLLNLDESSYEGGNNGESHPIAWYHEMDGGRAFYTGGGHTIESYSEPNFIQHILGGIKYAMGDGLPVDYASANVTPEENRFQKVVLDDYLEEPMELDLLPDGRIVFIQRRGKIFLYDFEEEESKEVAFVETFNDLEDGLLGLAIDPDYKNNKSIYLFYSHPTESYQQVSKFTFDPEADNVLSNEMKILQIPVQRLECCHSAGAMEIDKNGDLWISTGDNTNPHKSDGYNPIDERPNRFPFDAQKSSANTNDLRGKILRISPRPEGGYDIPAGNLFAADGSEGRPEIYIMGCRNPFRFSIDDRTGYVYWGDVGPDANKDGEARGPRGHDEINQAKAPGFFGWPYFIGDNKIYHEYDFVKEESGDPYNPDAPINNSPNNTGRQDLPAAQPAMIYYPYAPSTEFPALGTGGRNAMAGPVFYADDYPESSSRFPSYYDGKFFGYDWMRGWIMAVTFDESDNMAYMEPFLPSIKWNNLTDIIMSPKGDMYMLEYGTGWFTGNPDARLVHLKYTMGNREPIAEIRVDKTAGGLPFEVKFDGSSSVDNDGDDLDYSWDFGDGNKSKEIAVSHTYSEAGVYTARLSVQDDEGLKSQNQVKIYVGNEPPNLEWEIKGNQSFFWPGQSLEYVVKVSDKEDGNISDGIPEEAVMVSIDYLAQGFDMTNIAQGHQALSEKNSFMPGFKMVSETDCVSCHKTKAKSIGPSYIDIADKYVTQKNAVDYLTDKIINGGGGVWGETVMAAHPALSQSDANQMVKYILSLSDTAKGESLPVSGKYVLNKHEKAQPSGSYILTASYADRGAEGAEQMNAQKVISLRAPMMQATDYTSMEEAMKFTVTKDLVPTIEEPFDIMIGNHGGHIMYGNLDLTGIKSLVLGASATSPFMVGGKITVRVGGMDGNVIGRAELKPTEGMNPNPLVIALEPTSGFQDLYLGFESFEESKPVCSIIYLNFSNK